MILENDGEKFIEDNEKLQITDEDHSNKKVKASCQICKIKESIYRCPRCQIRTCCLLCVKEHKKIYKCSGTRDKFSKKSLKDFTENDFMRDMNFLSATINETNRIGKKVFNLTEENRTEIMVINNNSKINSETAFENDAKTSKLEDEQKQMIKDTKRNKNFKKLCKKFRNINLVCAPRVIKKYIENKSHCDSKLKKFFWTLKFNYYEFPEENLAIKVDNKLQAKFLDTKVILLENFLTYSHLFEDPIDDAVHNLTTLHNYLNQNKNLLEFSFLLKFKDHFENINNLIYLMRMNNEDLMTSNENRIKFLTPKERKFIFKIKDSFYEIIDKNTLIKDILNGKLVYEFPEFEIIPKNIYDKISNL